MIQITRRPRTELPTEPGFYLVHEAGNSQPIILRWARWSRRWEYPRAVGTVPVEGWDGPIKGVPDEFGDVAR